MKQLPPDYLFITLPLKSGREIPITNKQLAELEPLYPAVDVEQTVREMKGWLIGNPGRRPSTRMMAFVVSWLKREQEKYGGQEKAR